MKSLNAYIPRVHILWVGIADFMGIFFGYDFTGQSWTPILFGGIGQVLIVMEEQKIASN